MNNNLPEDTIEKRIKTALDDEELHFFDNLYEPDPLSFWDLVKKCDHKNRTDYYEDVGCSTPYCSGNESHCRDCGIYITECGCGSESGMSGWSHRRNKGRKWI